MSTSNIELLANREYKYGFVTDIESDTIPRGLTEETVRLISEKKQEPEWMLEFRLKAFRSWQKMDEPKRWANLKYPHVDFQDIIYYSAPKQKETLASLDEVDAYQALPDSACCHYLLIALLSYQWSNEAMNVSI